MFLRPLVLWRDTRPTVTQMSRRILLCNTHLHGALHKFWARKLTLKSQDF